MVQHTPGPVEIEKSEWGYAVVRDGEELVLVETLEEARAFVSRLEADNG